MPSTKIICTLGPASSNIETLRRMIAGGMSVARLNFSHGSHAEHKKRIDLIRKLNQEMGRDVRILQDLEGFRIRVGEFKNGDSIALEKGQIIRMTNRPDFDGPDVIPFDYPGSLNDIKRNSYVYINDGYIALHVLEHHEDYIKTEVVLPGIVEENKGVNVPGAELKFHEATEKDKRDIKFGLENKVDWIAQSFVRTERDIIVLNEQMSVNGGTAKIIAKIENREGIKNVDDIIAVSDGIMVARGDMGVSLPIYEVPMIQKMIINKCNEAGKIAITATQMLESMTTNIRPTRAEVSDVANAIIDGTDYIMLSGETAVGKYPVETVEMMTRIIKFTELSCKRKTS